MHVNISLSTYILVHYFIVSFYDILVFIQKKKILINGLKRLTISSYVSIYLEILKNISKYFALWEICLLKITIIYPIFTLSLSLLSSYIELKLVTQAWENRLHHVSSLCVSITSINNVIDSIVCPINESIQL